jgi:hypothetical protein
MTDTASSRGRRRSKLPARSWQRSLSWLAPTVLLLPLVWISTFWHLPTRVGLDFTTTRLNFTLEGDKNYEGGKNPEGDPEVFNRTVQFSSLVVNHCKTLRFAARQLEVPVPPHPPLLLTGQVTLICRDPGAKLTFRNSGATRRALGSLARIPLPPNVLVVIEAPKGKEPAVTLEIKKPQELAFEVLVPEVDLDAQFVQPEGVTKRLPNVLTYQAQPRENSSPFTLTSDSRGVLLTVTPVGPPTEIFRQDLDLPLSSIGLGREELEGKVSSALRRVTLSYLDYPAVPHVTIDNDNTIVLRGLSKARLKYLEYVDSDAKGGLQGRFEGTVRFVTIHDGAFVSNRDRRLTLFKIFRYTRYWIAVATCWLIATTWAAFGVWQSRPNAPAAEAPKMRILFLGVNPADSTRLSLDQEAHDIDRALTTAALGSRCELVQQWAVRVSELQEYLLRTRPNVVHFSGHGSADLTIALQGEGGATRPVAADLLARLLAQFNQHLRCVVLNACFTKAHGEAIAEHIDCVVGMSMEVGDGAAIRFAAAFYHAVASGCSIERAFELAKADIELGEMGEAEIPILLAKRCDPGKVFLVTGG